jgi:hypothetical protein
MPWTGSFFGHCLSPFVHFTPARGQRSLFIDVFLPPPLVSYRLCLILRFFNCFLFRDAFDLVCCFSVPLVVVSCFTMRNKVTEEYYWEQTILPLLFPCYLLPCCKRIAKFLSALSLCYCYRTRDDFTEFTNIVPSRTSFHHSLYFFCCFSPPFKY